jgi:hypothetical protein
VSFDELLTSQASKSAFSSTRRSRGTRWPTSCRGAVGKSRLPADAQQAGGLHHPPRRAAGCGEGSRSRHYRFLASRLELRSARRPTEQGSLAASAGRSLVRPPACTSPVAPEGRDLSQSSIPRETPHSLYGHLPLAGSLRKTGSSTLPDQSPPGRQLNRRIRTPLPATPTVAERPWAA